MNRYYWTFSSPGGHGAYWVSFVSFHQQDAFRRRRVDMLAGVGAVPEGLENRAAGGVRPGVSALERYQKSFISRM